MATNDYLPFGTGAGSNVIAQADYVALAARVAGFSAGVAKSNQLNKTWRQSSVIAAMIAQFTSDTLAQDVLDDGDLAALQAKFSAALLSAAPGRLLAIRTFTANGTYTPTAGTKSIIVEVVGGGGAGAGAIATTASTSSGGGSGGSGAYAKARFTSGFSGVAITIGAGGTAAAGAPGGAGGTTSFGALVTCPGGRGGSIGTQISSGSTNISGAGGLNSTAPSGGNILATPGISGQACLISAAGSFIGAGGSNPIGSGGQGYSAPGSATAGTNGGGGSGGLNGVSSAATPGGAGGAGLVVVFEFS
ncbi:MULTISPECIES: hypothetical protein [unclassified Achromobacter]|uniref:glycine-rich domain-containing protein n=1 Tax=unclassified Achromobacter TaxID=2626865 RepID=UPI0011786E68|nr:MULTISPECIES: hypothetical protein [unclassified Achromobacter]